MRAQWLFALGLTIGLTLGLGFTRVAGPLPVSDAEPWQLQDEERNHYMVAVALEHAHKGDLPAALDALIALRPQKDPLDALADAACALGGSGYLGSPGGISALRIVVDFYTGQGRAGCAEDLLPPADTATPPPLAETAESAAAIDSPVPTKPPLRPAAIQPTRPFVPTPTPVRRFEAISLRSFCDAERPAMIEIRVADYLGRGLPGQTIRARWGANEDTFLTGLKGERGLGYADFQMAEDTDYALDMPGAAQPMETSLRTATCYIDNQQSLKSWRVVFAER